MAKIPGIQRQRLVQALPAATLQVVQQSTAIEDAIGNAGNLVSNISNEMFKRDSDFQLSMANVNTQVELERLGLELSRGDSETALRDYTLRSREIYAKNAEGMSPLVLAEYDTNWATLNAKSELSLASTIAAKRSGERVAAMLSSLDSLKTFGATSDDPLRRSAALETGIASIAMRVAANDIKPAAGAKMRIKFEEEFNDATFTHYVNGLGQGEINSAFHQMSRGSFLDAGMEETWKKLSPKRQQALIGQVITNADRLLRRNDAQLARDAKEDAVIAKALSREFYTPGTNEDRRVKILGELADNGSMTVELYNKMVRDAGGATARFDDPVAIRKVDVDIMRRGHEITEAQIMAQPFSAEVIDRQLKELDIRRDARFSDAMDILTSSPLFYSDSMSTNQRRREDQKLTRRQLEIKHTLTNRQIQALDENEPYDPVDHVRELLETEANLSSGNNLKEKKTAAKAMLLHDGITEDLATLTAFQARKDVTPQARVIAQKNWNLVYGK